MASIELLPRKEFKITLDDGTEIVGRFGTFALSVLHAKQTESLAKGTVYTNIDAMLDYTLAAVECLAKKEGKPFSYTRISASDWIDEIGGVKSADAVALFAHAELTVASDEEKKTEVL